MFRIIKFLLIVGLLSAGIIWLVNNNGEVVISWLGYEVMMDMVTALFISLLFAILIFAFAYFLAKIMSFKFYNLFRVSIKKSRLNKLEAIIKRHNKSFDELTKTLFYLDVKDVGGARKSYKKFANLVKNRQINDFVSTKLKAMQGETGLAKFTKKAKGFFSRNKSGV